MVNLTDRYVILAMSEENTDPRNGAPYWRPDAHGYTESVAEAGLYTREQAAAHVAGSHGQHVVYALTGAPLRDYLRRWSAVRLSELGLWLLVQTLPENNHPQP